MKRKNFLRVFSIWFALTQIEMSAFVDTLVGVGWLAPLNVFSDIAFTKFPIYFQVVHRDREHNKAKEMRNHDGIEGKRKGKRGCACVCSK